jgi:hypothetical protein
MRNVIFYLLLNFLMMNSINPDGRINNIGF